MRRVPKKYQAVDSRGMIRVTLDTLDLATARARRDGMAEADDLFWAAALRGEAGARERYEAARARAAALGVKYQTAAEIAANETAAQILARLDMIPNGSTGHAAQVEAVLGGVTRPKTTLIEAFELYVDVIARDDVRDKSPKQLRIWRGLKLRAVNNFLACVGPRHVEDISRADAQAFYHWWGERIRPSDDGTAALSPSSGNRDIGNMRKLYGEFFRYHGEDDRPNPFRRLSFRERKISRPPFPTEWIRDVILKPGAMAALNSQARDIVLAMVETGCRPSELCNMPAECIRLDHAVPHISIRHRPGREIKTASSERDIPLLGVSLAAMRRNPQGFPRYRDNEDSLAALLGKYFRNNGLFPSPDHKIYSLRHSFEKRMQEAGIDGDLRKTLFGHKNDRPKYGDGGSLEYRRQELAKITLDYSPDLD
ncbi:MAG: integrase [Hyphomicrobiales bacterium]|nr:MAG: integrase [Hyphomicrobiales bacterium]